MVPAAAAVAAAGAIIAVGLFLTGPRNVGPPLEPTPTPSPTLTPVDARILTEPGDVIRIPALDGEGQFGTITIRRGDEKAGYEDFVPFTFQNVYFVEVYVKYEPMRPTAEEYGEWEFAYAIDFDGDGFDDDDRLERGAGFYGMEEMPGFESAPQPLLYGMRSGDGVLEGWLVLELPDWAADESIYLVYGHGEWTEGIHNMQPDTFALLRRPGEPVGVTPFDPDAFPTPAPGESVEPMPSRYALPSPPPEPAATFEPIPDDDADALFAQTQTCTNPEAGVIVTFPASWYSNEAGDDPFGSPVTECAWFSPEPINDLEALIFGDQPSFTVRALPDWLGGVEPPTAERFPLGDRMAWRLSYTPEQMSFGMQYLVQLGDDPYGPFVLVGTGQVETRAVIERMLLLLEIVEP
jgi:hypothetical protein